MNNDIVSGYVTPLFLSLSFIIRIIANKVRRFPFSFLFYSINSSAEKVKKKRSLFAVHPLPSSIILIDYHFG